MRTMSELEMLLLNVIKRQQEAHTKDIIELTAQQNQLRDALTQLSECVDEHLSLCRQREGS